MITRRDWWIGVWLVVGAVIVHHVEHDARTVEERHPPQRAIEWNRLGAREVEAPEIGRDLGVTLRGGDRGSLR